MKIDVLNLIDPLQSLKYKITMAYAKCHSYLTLTIVENFFEIVLSEW